MATIFYLFQITHWHSPYFHGYYAAGNSFPSILGDMLSDTIGCIGFSWVCLPLHGKRSISTAGFCQTVENDCKLVKKLKAMPSI